MSEGKQITNSFDGKLQKIFQDFFYNWVFTSEMSDQEIMNKYFSPDFSAIIDGVELERDDFLHRVGRMRREAVVERQEFIEMMEQGDRLFSMHTVKGQSLSSGQPFQTLAIALFIFEGDKIKKGYLNSSTEGDPRDSDIASRS